MGTDGRVATAGYRDATGDSPKESSRPGDQIAGRGLSIPRRSYSEQRAATGRRADAGGIVRIAEWQRTDAGDNRTFVERHFAGGTAADGHDRADSTESGGALRRAARGHDEQASSSQYRVPASGRDVFGARANQGIA